MSKKTTPFSCNLTVNLFSGSREPIGAKTNVLLNVRDGNQKEVHRRHHKASSIRITGLPFFNNFGDNYTVIASASKLQQAGFTPVKLSPQFPATVDLMLLPKDPSFNFAEAKWQAIRGNPKYERLLMFGASSEEEAEKRYADLLELRGPVLACLLNLVTAMDQIHLPIGSPVDYLRGLFWGEETMKQDRIFAWADLALVEQVERAAIEGQFKPEPGAPLFHPGATRSYKQVQFGEANVQITLHENDKQTIDGTKCFKVELDIDYYKDPGAHALLEVLNHRLTGAATDPRQVYVLRWIAGRHAGVPDFEPPYRLV
jgi:hypothetical protein